jgi:hypothetical protein
MVPTVYLFKSVDSDGTLYKIGFSKKSILQRKSASQTGCPHEITIVDKYESEYALKIETSLHNLYSYKNTHGEWFRLDISDEVNFKKICEKYHNIHKSIAENDGFI